MKRISFLWLLLIFFTACNQNKHKKAPENSDDEAVIEATTKAPVSVDLQDIKNRGKLKAITTYSTTSYFLYKGQPMGFEYELLKRLADHLGVELEIVLAKNLAEYTRLLNEGKGDIIALDLTVTKKRKKLFDFTEHHSLTQQVLIQKRPDNWRKMKIHEIEAALVRDPIELIGKKVYVKRGSSFVQRLKNLSEEIGGDIEIIEAEKGVDVEDLIEMVNNGEIDYTVTDKHVANINKTYHPNLDVKTAVSFNQRMAWAVRKTSPELKETINNWLAEMRKKPTYNVIYSKYFENKKAYKQRMRSKLFSLKGDQISEYDDLIQKYAKTISWDWRLLASLISQESVFDPERESWAGAKGLMQLMPRTGHAYGAENLFDPEENLKAGTSYLKHLEQLWKEVPDSSDRIKFVLASYNVGEGHLQDARNLTEKYGKSPNKWEDVSKYLLLKSNEKYYNDEVVKYGYCRGQEPVEYVEKIFRRYKHYLKFIGKEKEKV